MSGQKRVQGDISEQKISQVGFHDDVGGCDGFGRDDNDDGDDNGGHNHEGDDDKERDDGDDGDDDDGGDGDDGNDDDDDPHQVAWDGYDEREERVYRRPPTYLIIASRIVRPSTIYQVCSHGMVDMATMVHYGLLWSNMVHIS